MPKYGSLVSAEHKRAVRRLMAVKTCHCRVYMVANISTDLAQRAAILTIDAIIFVILAIYAALWSKIKLKLPLFRPLSLEKVMAMEHPAYFQLQQEAARKQREQQKRERQVTSHSL